jgi:hypothetical protein
MTIERERLEKIRANAAFVVDTLGELSGMNFGYGGGSIEWVEGFLERQRETLTDEAANRLINVIGCYLGEAIIAAVPGARWDEDVDGNLGVAFPNGDMSFPFAKVAKQLSSGRAEGDSIHSFYDVSVNYVATGRLREPNGGDAQ